MEAIQTYIANQPLWVQTLTGLVELALVAAAANFIIKKVILRAAAPFLDRRSLTVDKAAARLANVIPALIVAHGIVFVPYLPEGAIAVIRNVARACIVLSVAFALSGGLNYVNELYQRRPEARSRPIKGYIQVLKIVLFGGATILIIATLMEQSPLLLLSGLGAMAAVLMLVFKDTILSLVASVQLGSNDMLRVGDWIEMPQLNADGDVVDIALHTVKVQNWDKTITTIPTHRLIAESYKNWRGMQESGGRRIKRSLLIDQNSVRFLQPDEIQRVRRFRLLDDYVARKDEEIRRWNDNALGDEGDPVNARRLTNVGTFRAYVFAYLQAHDQIRDDMTLLVRQLTPTSQGLPLEIYCFTSTVAWDEYEAIQADIFDHLLAIMPEFGLRIFQEPSGLDLHERLASI
ncbi:mechanosensitive ion channel family protein [Croceicoccus estronivorus]|uniref:mechanosensitive ion channel family protein n=1 Tax=Croceicoccus estronivorus TaxID=1172626 RepID=UPI0038B280D0